MRAGRWGGGLSGSTLAYGGLFYFLSLKKGDGLSSVSPGLNPFRNLQYMSL